MSKEILKPVYESVKRDSSCREVDWRKIKLEEIYKEVNKGWIVLWRHHKVLLGQIKADQLKEWLNADGEELPKFDGHLVRLRIFNKDMEYHFWRSSDDIKGRLRDEKFGDKKVEWIDTEMVLRGVIGEPLKNMGNPPDELKGAEKISIRTRNYIDYHPVTKQAGYIDSRFVEFVKIQ